MSTGPPLDVGGSPPDPREERYRPLGDFLVAEVIAVVILAVATLAGVGGSGRATGVGMVALLVVVPAVRVLWLTVRWARRGDRRFALVGVAVLVVPVVALVASH